MKRTQKEQVSLGERMKGYEEEYENRISEDLNIVVRLDGHKFSKFTKGLKKPFDDIIFKSFKSTCSDLLEEFHCSTVYYQSDEITLIFPTEKDRTVDNRKSNKHKLHKLVKQDWNHIYSGRVQKLTSLIAGFCTMRFSEHFRENAFKILSNSGVSEDEKYIETLQKKIGASWFDARAYGVSDEEAFNSVLWRYRDCYKNSKSMVAQAYCSHKSLMNKTSDEQIQFCKDTTGHDWNEIEMHYRYGLFTKREDYLKMTERGEVKRSRTVQFSLEPDDFGFSRDNVQMILAKKY